MRTILIATDFSDAARRAALYGLQIAKAFNARVILLHTYQAAPLPLPDSLVIINQEDMAELVHRQLKDEVACLGVENEIPIQVLAEEGPAAETVLATAQRLKADLVVCGMKTGGKGTRRLFGSVVTTMTKKTGVPLLIIPESAKFESPRILALAEDIHPDADVHVLDMLRSIAQRFHSKLYMINVVKDAAEASQPGLHLPGNLRKVVQTLDPIYEYPADTDVIHALKHAVGTYGVNMLAMIPHRYSPFTRLFKGSHAKAMIFETSIPLLILPDIRRKSSVIPLFNVQDSVPKGAADGLS